MKIKQLNMKSLVIKLFEKVEAATQLFGYIPMHIVSNTAIDPLATLDYVNTVYYNRVHFESDTYPIKVKLGTPDLVKFAAVKDDNTYDIVDSDTIELISCNQMQYGTDDVRYVYLCSPDGITSVDDGIIYIEDKITSVSQSNINSWAPDSYVNGTSTSGSYNWFYASDLNKLTKLNAITSNTRIYFDEVLNGTYKNLFICNVNHNNEYPYIDCILENAKVLQIFDLPDTFSYTNPVAKITLKNCTEFNAIDNLARNILFHIDGTFAFNTIMYIYNTVFNFDDTNSADLFITALAEQDISLWTYSTNMTVRPIPSIDTTTITELFTAAGKTITFENYS